MIKYLIIALLSLCISSKPINADELPPELIDFGDLSSMVPINDDYYATHKKSETPQSFKQEIIPYIKENILEQASYNISNPEQVFCYHISKRPKGYKGYTLNNYAINDFCGQLNIDEIATTYEALFTRSPNIIISQANCRIEPKVMLRFVRGVDYTDVLLSSPCPSFTIFYAGRYKAFNIQQAIIDDIIQQFTDKKEQFNSPSFLKQLVANGKATTVQEEHELEKKQKEFISSNKSTQAETPAKKDTPTKKGWGNIKLNMQKQ